MTDVQSFTYGGYTLMVVAIICMVVDRWQRAKGTSHNPEFWGVMIFTLLFFAGLVSVVFANWYAHELMLEHIRNFGHL